MSELATADITKTIKDKIKNQFVDLIPDEAFQKMVETGVREFTCEVKNRYNKKISPSPMQKIINEIIAERYRENIKAELAKPEYDNVWNGTGFELPELFKAMVIKTAPEILEAMISNYTTQIVNNLKNNSF